MPVPREREFVRIMELSVPAGYSDMALRDFRWRHVSAHSRVPTNDVYGRGWSPSPQEFVSLLEKTFWEEDDRLDASRTPSRRGDSYEGSGCPPGRDDAAISSGYMSIE